YIFPSFYAIYSLSLHDALPISDLVLSHLTECGHVADLFAGCGTFALRLARSVRVRAVEGNTAALAALDAAARHAQGLKPVTTQKDRKSTRLNSSHVKISYAVFC